MRYVIRGACNKSRKPSRLLSLRKKINFGTKDSFLGVEWVSVLLEDSVRFQGTGKLGLRGVDPEHGEMAWVEPTQLEYGYPALHELVVNVHALAFELNLKDPRLRLSHPFRGEGVLHHTW